MNLARTATAVVILVFISLQCSLQADPWGTHHTTLYTSHQSQNNFYAQRDNFMDDFRRQMQADQQARRQQVRIAAQTEAFARAVAEAAQRQAAAQPPPQSQQPALITKPAMPPVAAQPQPEPIKPLSAEQPAPVKKDPLPDPLAQERTEKLLFFNNAAVNEVVKNCQDRADASSDAAVAAVLKERARAIADATKNKDPVLREQQFPLHVYEIFPRATQFDSLRGNAVSAQLHDELRGVVQAAAELTANATVAPAVKGHADGIFTFCELAAQQRNPDVAFALAEVGMNLLLAAQATQTALAAAQEQVDKLLIARAADTRAVPRVKPANYQSPYEQLTEKINAPLIRAARALRDAYEAARRERTAKSAVEPAFELATPQDLAALAAQIIKNFAPFPPCARPEALEGNARNDNIPPSRSVAAEHEKMLLALQASIDEQAAHAQKIITVLEDMREVEQQRTWVTKDYLLRRNGAQPYTEKVCAHSDAENEIITQPLKAVLEEVFLHAYPSRHPSGSSGRAQGGGAAWSSSSCPAPARLNCVQPTTALVLRSDASSRLEGYARPHGGGPDGPEEPEERKELQPNQPPEPPSFHNREYLHQLAQKYAEQLAEIKASHPGYAQYHVRLQDRNRGLLGSLDLCGDVQEQSEKFPDEVYAQFPEAHAFDEFSGNAAQHVLHNELRENIQLATEAAVQFRDEAYIQAQIPAVFAFTDLARQQDNPEAAFSLSDTALHILNAAKMMSRELIDSDNTVGYAAGAVIGGGIKAIERTVDHFVEFVCNPGETVVRDTIGIYKLGYHAFKTAGTLIAGSSRERAALWENTKAAAQFIKNNPDELVAFAFQCYLPTPQSALRAVTSTSSMHRLATTIEKQKQFYKAVKRKLDERFLSQDYAAITPEGLTIQELKWAAKPTEMMLKKSMGEKNPHTKSAEKPVMHAPTKADVIANKYRSRSALPGCKADPTAPRRECISDGKHHLNSSGNISPAPKPGEGQRGLDWSIPHPDEPAGRIGVGKEQFIEYKYSYNKAHINEFIEQYHGYVLAQKWEKLDKKIQNALKNSGLVDKTGKIISRE